MTFAHPGKGSLTYRPCSYGSSRLLFRGPKSDLTRPYAAFFGGTETYGRFIERPFPELVAERFGLGCVNLGRVNGGIDVYLHDPSALEIAAGAEVTVIQVTGAHNLSNRYYSVHPRRNDRFLGATPLLHELFDDMDFTEVSFTRHLMTALHGKSEQRFHAVIKELQATWVRRMRDLLGRIPGRKILLWLGRRHPGEPASSDASYRNDPLYVDQPMLKAVADLVDAETQVIFAADQSPGSAEGMVFSEIEMPVARETPDASVHRSVAEALSGVMREQFPLRIPA